MQSVSGSSECFPEVRSGSSVLGVTVGQIAYVLRSIPLRDVLGEMDNALCWSGSQINGVDAK